VVYNNLEERHIQIFLHDKKAQRAIARLGWDGAFNQPTCSGNCVSDWLGIIDANVGVNKANYFIERRTLMAVVFEQKKIKRYLTLFIKNKADQASSKLRYKTYLRLVVPQQNSFAEVEISEGNQKQSIVPEVVEIGGRKEAGVLVEVKPGQEKSITFNWEGPVGVSFNKPGEYRFYWRKQAGTVADLVGVKFFFPSNLKVKVMSPFPLTGGEIPGYNTPLSRDLVSRIYW
jgi:hypothetical protein